MILKTLNRLILLAAFAVLTFASCDKDDDVSKGNTSISGDTGTLTDKAGNTYNIVKIGEQWWMAENFKSTKFNDGTDIAYVQENSEWVILETPAYCWYDNNEAIYSYNYGVLYNWYVINSGKLCPDGWHVPTKEEWIELSEYASFNGEYGASGSYIASTSGWKSSNDLGDVGNDQVSNNESGFNGKPGGYRSNSGNFNYEGELAYWWTSSETNDFTYAYRTSIGYYGFYIDLDYSSKQTGYSLRLVRD